MISSYLAGERVVSIAERSGCPRTTLYAVLRSVGIEPGRHQRSGPPTKAHHCVVCGGRKRTPPSGHLSGGWARQPTCGSPDCVSLLLYVPHKKVSRFWSGHRDPLLDVEIDYVEMAEFDDELGHDDELERDYEVFEDERGADIPESMTSFPWSSLSMVTIAMMAPVGEPSEISLRLSVPPRETFVGRYFGGDLSMAKSFEIIYAWRCGCPEQALYVLKTVEDIPEEPGYYGACPRCGSVALAVVEGK